VVGVGDMGQEVRTQLTHANATQRYQTDTPAIWIAPQGLQLIQADFSLANPQRLAPWYPQIYTVLQVAHALS